MDYVGLEELAGKGYHLETLATSDDSVCLVIDLPKGYLKLSVNFPPMTD